MCLSNLHLYPELPMSGQSWMPHQCRHGIEWLRIWTRIWMVSANCVSSPSTHSRGSTRWSGWVQALARLALCQWSPQRCLGPCGYLALHASAVFSVSAFRPESRLHMTSSQLPVCTRHPRPLTQTSTQKARKIVEKRTVSGVGW